MKRDEVTGSKNYNAEDLKQGDLTLVVSDVTQEEYKQEDGYNQKKLVVSFRAKEKRLICGKTKANALFDLLGEDTDDWVGQRIRLCLGKTSYAGKRVDCVDIKEAPARTPVAAPAATGGRAETGQSRVRAGDAEDDDIPF